MKKGEASEVVNALQSLIDTRESLSANAPLLEQFGQLAGQGLSEINRR